jgi:TRAP transporter TAXI family solute receptor
MINRTSVASLLICVLLCLSAFASSVPKTRLILATATTGGTYPGQEQDIPTISQPNLWVVHRDVPEDVVYLLVKILYSNLEYLRKVHQATASLSLEDATSGLALPLHPGAVRFYKEQDLEQTAAKK